VSVPPKRLEDGGDPAVRRHFGLEKVPELQSREAEIDEALNLVEAVAAREFTLAVVSEGDLHIFGSVGSEDGLGNAGVIGYLEILEA